MSILGLGQRPSEKLRKDLEKKRDELLAKSSRLKRLIAAPNSGWSDFILVIDQYVDWCNKRKSSVDLSQADDAVFNELKLMDNYVNALKWARQIPQQFIENLDKAIELQKQKEENDAKGKEVDPNHFV